MPGHDLFAPDFAVHIEGLTLAADVRHAVTSLSYDNNLDAADMFTIQLSNAGLRLIDSALLDVGKQVEISMGYAGALEPMMLGEITAVSPSFPESGAPSLTVTGYDKSHRLRNNSPARPTFTDTNDSAIVAQIALENGLLPIVDPSPMPDREWPQTGSDWALLSEIAQRNYFELFVRWDRLYFRFPRPQTELMVLEWGKSLSSFNPRLSTSGQHALQVVRGYDEQLAQTIVAILPTVQVGTDLDNLVERLGSGIVDTLSSLGRHVVNDRPVRDFLEANLLAQSILKQMLEGLYEGSGSCIGTPTLRAGDLIEIRGVGKRFSGSYRLSRVTHTIDSGGYRTSFEVTQRHNATLLQSLRAKIEESPSPNRQERISGVVPARVVNNSDDPQKLGRVRVTFPHLSDDNISPWARVATLFAGGTLANSWGAYFLPDVGDEVLVAFEQGDIRVPVVIGALWNGMARPPEQNEGKNARKVIKTRTGMQIVFDETTGAEKLTLRDKAGSMIQMDSVTGDILIQAKGNITIQSGTSGKIDLNP